MDLPRLFSTDFYGRLQARKNADLSVPTAVFLLPLYSQHKGKSLDRAFVLMLTADVVVS